MVSSLFSPPLPLLCKTSVREGTERTGGPAFRLSITGGGSAAGAVFSQNLKGGIGGGGGGILFGMIRMEEDRFIFSSFSSSLSFSDAEDRERSKGALGRGSWDGAGNLRIVSGELDFKLWGLKF